MQNTSLPVPLMRDYVQVGSASTVVASKTASAAMSVAVFVVPALIGFAVAMVTGNKMIFLVLLVAGIVASAVSYFLRNLLPAKGGSPENQILRAYQPVLAQISSGGFEASVDSTKTIVKISLALREGQPQIFGIADESVKFFLERLAAIANAKKILGDEREMKRRVERLQNLVQQHLKANQPPEQDQGLRAEITDLESRLAKLEDLHRAALQLTTELSKLRADCESALVQNVTGTAADQTAARLLRERIECEKRVALEMAQLGL